MIDTFVFGTKEESTDGSSTAGSDPVEENGFENELLVERHLLRTQLTAVETRLREASDELYFSGLRYKEKETTITELHTELDTERGKVKTVTKQMLELQRTCQAQYSQILELQYQVRQGQGQPQSQLEKQRQGSEKFHKQKDLTMTLLKRKRKLKEANLKLQRQVETLEASQMQMEDPQGSTIGDMLQLLRQRDEAVRAERNTWHQKQRSNSMHIASSGSATGRESRSEAAWDLPLYKTVLTTPDDAYLECKLQKSVFGENLASLRKEVSPLLKELKEASDRSANHLWGLFTNKRAAYRPKEEFFKETSALLTRSKVFVAETLRKVNTFAKNLMREEKTFKDKWLAEHAPSVSAGCQVDIELPPDPRIQSLENEIAMLKKRLTKLRQDHTITEQDTALAKDKAELCLAAVQRKFFSLHQELYTALHLVFKHRYRWIARLPNPLRDLKQKTSGKVRTDSTHLSLAFNAQLGNVVDKVNTDL
eukprot:TRINITY_DN13351_c0_g1_i2.p1 TRINITY_DN13351_c0_g1~~TRINITY_DN13351_c0_g1_i2.p1  ORF type:complete len:480 (+),score=125.04 TRINITY_DN13351_c0_g1_i2:38-1477(+)